MTNIINSLASANRALNELAIEVPEIHTASTAYDELSNVLIEFDTNAQHVLSLVNDHLLGYYFDYLQMLNIL